jgi:hypothetical protein
MAKRTTRTIGSLQRFSSKINRNRMIFLMIFPVHCAKEKAQTILHVLGGICPSLRSNTTLLLPPPFSSFLRTEVVPLLLVLFANPGGCCSSFAGFLHGWGRSPVPRCSRHSDVSSALSGYIVSETFSKFFLRIDEARSVRSEKRGRGWFVWW